jgi:hypothetical protein
MVVSGNGFCECGAAFELEDRNMSQNTVIVQGIVTADGTLELAEKLTVPAGRVQVAIQPLPDVSSDPFLQRMEKIWAGQRARGHVPRTREEIDAELRELREDGLAEIEATERMDVRTDRFSVDPKICHGKPCVK